MNIAKSKIRKDLFIQYIWVWTCFFAAIILVVWVSLPLFYIPCRCSEDTCNAINNIIFTISISYIAGFIFFLLSVFCPTAKKKYEEERLLVDLLNNLTKDFYGLFNNTDKSNYQRLPFPDLSQSMFQEDVSNYNKSIELLGTEEECEYDVHFHPHVLFNLELRANYIREDLNVLQMYSHIEPFDVINIIGLIKSSKLLSYIDSQKAYRANFNLDDLKIRFALFKQMMKDYYELETILMNITNAYNRYYPNHKIWQQ